MRISLADSFDRLEKIITQTVEELDDAHVRCKDITKKELAAFIINSLQGSILRMKVVKSEDPLILFKKMVFSKFLVH